jgi:hypothetical protein
MRSMEAKISGNAAAIADRVISAGPIEKARAASLIARVQKGNGRSVRNQVTEGLRVDASDIEKIDIIIVRRRLRNRCRRSR